MNDSTSPPSGPLALGGSVWFQAGQQTLGGAARIALLAAIRDTGSITGAAKAVGMSYKGAWDAIDAMNNLAGEPLVVRSTGGKGGGGTTLTPRAIRLIDTFHAIEREHRRFLERAGAAIDGFGGDWALLGRIGLRMSARNQLYGTVVSVVRGAVNDEVSIALPGGHTIVAVVTCESTETLGLAPGSAALALVKASSVVLVAGDGVPMRLSARNQLQGVVGVIRRGAVNAEVAVELPGGAVIVGVVTDGSVDALGLAVGQPATAVFKASSVILGVSG
ncbi:TOBE domain-containing protein [Paraburkholderia caballeronis]|uniref:Transcriptional regulator, ModE family n=1 Tax=Paraburkholderia caballeronis TaxID=416943 RepID=A0A1H7KVL4_9BURK|nr:TOBE domain-containing protein [Paraburkholderia caballeronis]PXW28187.1 ModE family transcriptional regulator [Paraburkholderia caballeronis]PXX03553.1 ModE family transcriptional regulator [Paraburkholderia caballeronis]RAK04297.1 ModE family transcriptional regulator [Paraburkholderia caballeronis]SED85878.1 transcriptional regulator, ModE family [Paraburkholderia caballeronis]SEK90903.1 transcriptional regulator, ModE family [Paraburkholderia caballeronis]